MIKIKLGVVTEISSSMNKIVNMVMPYTPLSENAHYSEATRKEIMPYLHREFEKPLHIDLAPCVIMNDIEKLVLSTSPSTRLSMQETIRIISTLMSNQITDQIAEELIEFILQYENQPMDGLMCSSTVIRALSVI